MWITSWFLGAALVIAPLLPIEAQEQERERRERVERERDIARARIIRRGENDNRAVLGVHTTSSGERDTLGLLIMSIVPGGPAEQAGLVEGNRIAAINDVDLTLSAADAGERDMRGMTTRRLTRELSKVEPGQEVRLRVWQDGRYRDMQVKTVAAEDLPGRRRMSAEERRQEREDRAVLGVSLSASATARDTLGVLIVRVAPNGPAERAGLLEGNRIAAINDVILQVDDADVEDRWAAGAMVNRLNRELRDLEPGEEVRLRVWQDGQFRTVTLRAARAGDVYENRGNVGFFFDGTGDGMMMITPDAPLPPHPPGPVAVPAPAPIAPFIFDRVTVDPIEVEVRVAAEHARAAAARARAHAEAAHAAVRTRHPGVYEF